MEILKEASTFLSGFVIATSALALALWKADALISDAGAKRLYGAINQTLQAPRDSKIARTLESLLDHYFSLNAGWPTFLKNVFILTLCTLVALLCIYVVKTPELAGQLLTKRFLRQFFGNGFVVTFAVNCVAFSQYKRLTTSFVTDSLPRNLAFIGLDFLLKAFTFVVFTLLTYFVFALATDAFSKNVPDVPRVAATTILLALRFENLTGVYVYSLVLSSFPIFVVVIVKLMLVSPTFAKVVQQIFFWLPFENKPIRATTLVLAIFASLFALFLVLLTAWI